MVSRAFVYGKDYTIWDDSLDRSLLIQARKDQKIRCLCGKPLTFVDATVKIPHFRHRRGNCLVIGAERDTETHNHGLEYLGQLLRKSLSGATVEKERTFKVRLGLRRSDIFAKLPDGKTICYELQCSPLSLAEFAERIAAYRSLGHRVVWIFGPDASGIRITPITTRFEDLLTGLPYALKELPFSCLREQGNLLLYFPNLQEKLWIAYCADGRFDRTREVTLGTGDKQFLIRMPEPRLAMFAVQFRGDGLPYARAFPVQELAAALKGASSKLVKARGIYARELKRIDLYPRKTTIPKKQRKNKSGPRFRPHFPKETSVTSRLGNQCNLCSSRIVDQHYHRCSECGGIFCDACTMKIENDLNQPDHNMTGWVNHCYWIARRSE